jgi:PKD repeat protein
MKKLSIVLTFLFAIGTMSIMAQGICAPLCTSDASCVDLLNPGEICPEVLPTANVGAYYDETVTVIPPDEYEGFSIISAVRLDEVNGLPEGMSWCKSADKFTVTSPATRYCCQLTGTPTTPGTYQLSLVLTPFIGPVPSGQVTDDTSLVIVVLPALPVAAFSANPTSSEINSDVVFTDLTTNNPTQWLWTFEGGTPPTSDVQNPTVYWTVQGAYDVSLTAINEGGSNSITLSDYITITDHTGITDLINGSGKIYPNPTSHQLTVEASNLESITIVDVLGKIVYSQSAKSDKETVDVSNLLKANYFIKVKTAEGEITKSITIK